MNVTELKNKVLGGYALTYEEGVALTQLSNKEELYQAADEIRAHFCGNKMDLCSITNAKSGKCSEDCKWCSQSAHHKTNVEEYEVVDRAVALKEAKENDANGVKRQSLVTSGKRVSDKTLDNLLPIYKEIREKTKMGTCASMGLITETQMRRLQEEAGIDHYHCNIETAPSFFAQVCSTHTMEEKIETINIAHKLGIRVCSGGIIGLGETMEQRVEMAATLRDLKVQSIPINILMPVKGTPMENNPMLTEEEIMTTIAVFRFINPKANLRFAGGRMQIKDYQHKALRAGINAALTGNYLTTTGSQTADDLRDFKAAGFDVE